MHRDPVLNLLRAHAARALDAHEAAMTAETIRFVEAHGDCLLRTCGPGHLTGSAWIVNAERTRTLLTHHRKLKKWLQLGGHADGDPDLLAVALREAREESGLAAVRAVAVEINVPDSHSFPAARMPSFTKRRSCSLRLRKNSVITIWVAARPAGVFMASALAKEMPPAGRSHQRSRPVPRSPAPGG